jgi:hypothetical protein
MQIEQRAISPDSSGSFVSLSNLTAGAIWEPLSFRLDRFTGLIFTARKERGAQLIPDGLGANVITLSKGGLSRRMLAIYKVGEEWKLFDGNIEHPLASVTVSWAPGTQIIPRVFSLATLKFICNGIVTEIKYFRPSLRHWFEGGWALEDIDIGHLIARLSKNPVGLLRLDSALKMGKEADTRQGK